MDLLLPEPSPPERRAVTIEAPVGLWGGPTLRYRGARIEGNEKEAVFGLFLEGHPLRRQSLGSWENLVVLVDWWLGRQTLPLPYA